jgi:hypothetical protein
MQGKQLKGGTKNEKNTLEYDTLKIQSTHAKIV